jgi:hypothetical protein
MGDNHFGYISHFLNFKKKVVCNVKLGYYQNALYNNVSFLGILNFLFFLIWFFNILPFSFHIFLFFFYELFFGKLVMHVWYFFDFLILIEAMKSDERFTIYPCTEKKCLFFNQNIFISFFHYMIIK